MTEDRKNVVDLVDAAPRQFSNALARKHFRHLSEAQTPHANTRYQYKLTRAHEWSRQYYEAENFLRRAFILCLFLAVWVFSLHGPDYRFGTVASLAWAAFCLFALKMFNRHLKADLDLINRSAFQGRCLEEYVR